MFPSTAHISTSPSFLGFTNSFVRVSEQPHSSKTLKGMTDLMQFPSTRSKLHLLTELPKTPSVLPGFTTLCKHPLIYATCLKCQCFDIRNGKIYEKDKKVYPMLIILFAGQVTLPELLLCPSELSRRKLVACSKQCSLPLANLLPPLGLLMESRRLSLRGQAQTSFIADPPLYLSSFPAF